MKLKIDTIPVVEIVLGRHVPYVT